MQDPEDGEQRAQVRRHRLLEREQLVHLLLDPGDEALDIAVVRIDPVDQHEVGIEQRVGRRADLLAAPSRELHDLAADFLLLLVERSAGLGHGPLGSGRPPRVDGAGGRYLTSAVCPRVARGPRGWTACSSPVHLRATATLRPGFLADLPFG